MGGFGAFFLLLDQPETYGLPPDPVSTTRDLPRMLMTTAAAIGVMAAGLAGLLRRRWTMALRRRAAAGLRRCDRGTGARGLRGRDPARRRHRRGGEHPGYPQRRRARPGRTRERSMVPPAKPQSYYGQPIIKEPVWSPEIAWYLFVGGLAGASAPMAWLAEARGNQRLARRGWLVALLGAMISPVLLIKDLGRPGRFLNMLRVLKVTSPMSLGSWILSGFGTATGLAVVQELFGWFPRLGRGARRRARRCSATGWPLTPRSCSPTPPFRYGTRLAASFRSCSWDQRRPARAELRPS